jgi:hypothetical protein
VIARGISWPTWGRLTTGLAGALQVSLVFFPVYLGCAAVTAARGSHWHPYASWELSIPFVPFMIVPYLSMFVLFVIPPFQLDELQLRSLTARLIVASLLGGLVFLALPAEMGFVTHDDAGRWQGIYSALYRIDGPFNTIPSFHVIHGLILAMIEAATRCSVRVPGLARGGLRVDGAHAPPSPPRRGRRLARLRGAGVARPRAARALLLTAPHGGSRMRSIGAAASS